MRRALTLVLAALATCAPAQTRIEEVPAQVGDSPGGLETATLWATPTLDPGRMIHVPGRIEPGREWPTVKVGGRFYLPPGRRIVGWARFAATDPGSCFEGDVVLTQGNAYIAISAPHKHEPRGIYDAWSSDGLLAPGYSTNEEPFYVWLTCRTVCSENIRCHYGVRITLAR